MAQSVDAGLAATGFRESAGEVSTGRLQTWMCSPQVAAQGCSYRTEFNGAVGGVLARDSGCNAELAEKSMVVAVW